MYIIVDWLDFVRWLAFFWTMICTLLKDDLQFLGRWLEFFWSMTCIFSTMTWLLIFGFLSMRHILASWPISPVLSKLWTQRHLFRNPWYQGHQFHNILYEYRWYWAKAELNLTLRCLWRVDCVQIEMSLQFDWQST